MIAERTFDPFRVMVVERLSRRGRFVRAWAVYERQTPSGNVLMVKFAGELSTSPPEHPFYPDGDVYVWNEGITWCRDWKGEAVDALKVAQALR